MRFNFTRCLFFGKGTARASFLMPSRTSTFIGALIRAGEIPRSYRRVRLEAERLRIRASPPMPRAFGSRTPSRRATPRRG